MDYLERKLDDKNRLTIPAELRHEFEGGKVIMTRGFEPNYLHLYTQKVWDQEMEVALQGNILNKEIADLNVQFRLGKSAAQMDAKQGRITIEQHLLDWAGVQKDVKLVRVGHYWRLYPAEKLV